MIGYITVGTERIGAEKQYIQLVTFQVSEPFRGMGVGKKLFEKAVPMFSAEDAAAYAAAEKAAADKEPFKDL